MTKTEYETRINELLMLVNEHNVAELLQEYNTVLLKYRMLYETPEQHSHMIDMFNRVGEERMLLAA